MCVADAMQGLSMFEVADLRRGEGGPDVIGAPHPAACYSRQWHSYTCVCLRALAVRTAGQAAYTCWSRT